MAIKETNSRFTITLPTKLKELLYKEAENEFRTLSKQVELILRERYNYKD